MVATTLSQADDQGNKSHEKKARGRRRRRSRSRRRSRRRSRWRSRRISRDIKVGGRGVNIWFPRWSLEAGKN